ncbi:MAG: MaoC family dehydratase N-terminal domain-containing protein [Chloroflexota bacterium]|nr:MaoC family dehydratase N-terminal domain-containing protein [Chloroflexota bacterium]
MTTTTEASEITDEMVEALRQRIGVVWKPSRPYFNTVASADAIRHFCDGIGDPNPLYVDPEYAKKSKYGRLAAPPMFLYSVYWAAQGRGMPGIHAWHSGDDWEFHQPILEGDQFTYTNTLVDAVVKESKMAGRTVIQYHDICYYNQRGELAAKALDWCVRAARKQSGDTGKYASIPPASYSPEEIEKIYADYAAEEVRGANPRYWEDVNVGDALQPVVKGPLSRRDMYAWLIGAGSVFMRAHGNALSFLKRHNAAEMVDAKTGIPDVPELVHMEDSRAQTIGIPGAYDYGCQRISWLGNLVTNWIGDDGFLKRCRAELRRFNVVGDTQWLKGKVVKKYLENGEHLVEIDCWGENQRGEVTMPGVAIVRLPSRGA